MKTILLITFVGFVLVLALDKPYSDLTAPYIAAQSDAPYSTETTARIMAAYHTSDTISFAYPAYSLFIFAPFSLPPFPVATALWQAVQIALVLLALRTLGVTPLASVSILIALREPLVNVLVGNCALWVTAWIGFGIASLGQGLSKRAALCFALASIQPTLAVPMALLLLARHRRALAAYLMGMALVLFVSLVAFGWWLPDWIGQIVAYSAYTGHSIWTLAAFPSALIVVGVALLLWWQTGAYGLLVGGLTVTLPLTGLYHLSLYALVRLPARWWLLVGVLMWGMSALPFAVRQFEPLALAGVVLVYTVRSRSAAGMSYERATERNIRTHAIADG